MFDHVGIWVSDRAASERFYRTVLDAIGIAPTSIGEESAAWNDFALGQARADAPGTRSPWARGVGSGRGPAGSASLPPSPRAMRSTPSTRRASPPATATTAR